MEHIVHYKNGNWTKLESGTDVNLLDVWGSPDGSVVWACGYDRAKPGTFLLRSTVAILKWLMMEQQMSLRYCRIQSRSMTSVYTLNGKRIFICTTSGVYNAPSNTKKEGKRLSFTSGQFPGLPNRLGGNGINDFTIVGEYSFIGHYNGYDWRYFDELWTDILVSIRCTQRDLVLAVRLYILSFMVGINLSGNEIK